MHPTCRSAILRSKAASRCTHECHTPRSRSRMRRLGGGQSMKPSRRRRRSPRLTNTSPPSVLPAGSSRPNARIAAMAVTRGPPAGSYGAAACHRARMPRARRGRRRLRACRGTWPASARRRHSSRRRGRRCRHPTRRAWSGLRRGAGRRRAGGVVSRAPKGRCSTSRACCSYAARRVGRQRAQRRLRRVGPHLGSADRAPVVVSEYWPGWAGQGKRCASSNCRRRSAPRARRFCPCQRPSSCFTSPPGRWRRPPRRRGGETVHGASSAACSHASPSPRLSRLPISNPRGERRACARRAASVPDGRPRSASVPVAVLLL